VPRESQSDDTGEEAADVGGRCFFEVHETPDFQSNMDMPNFQSKMEMQSGETGTGGTGGSTRTPRDDNEDQKIVGEDQVDVIQTGRDSTIPDELVKKATSFYQMRQKQGGRSTVSLATSEGDENGRGFWGKYTNLIWLFLTDSESSRGAYYYSTVMSIILQCSVILSVLQTVEPPPIPADTSAIIQSVIDILFLAEWIARFICSRNVKSFVKSFLNITDLLAASLPLLCRGLQLIGVEAESLTFVVFSLSPVLRELKVLKSFQQFHLFILLADDIREAVQLLMMLLAIVILGFSSLLYAVEPAGGTIGSMPQAMWLTVVTITTVGYGDVVPLTDSGKVITSILTLFSVLYTAMPIGIIGNAFTQIWLSRDRILLMVKTRDIMVRAGYTAEDVVLVFREYCTPGDDENENDGGNEVQFEGFLQMIQDMKLGLPEERAIAVFESIDRDGGGSIDEQEFVRSIFPGSHRAVKQNDDKPKEEPQQFGRQVSNQSARSVNSKNSDAGTSKGNGRHPRTRRRPSQRSSVSGDPRTDNARTSNGNDRRPSTERRPSQRSSVSGGSKTDSRHSRQVSGGSKTDSTTSKY